MESGLKKVRTNEGRRCGKKKEWKKENVGKGSKNERNGEIARKKRGDIKRKVVQKRRSI